MTISEDGGTNATPAKHLHCIYCSVQVYNLKNTNTLTQNQIQPKDKRKGLNRFLDFNDFFTLFLRISYFLCFLILLLLHKVYH